MTSSLKSIIGESWLFKTGAESDYPWKNWKHEYTFYIFATAVLFVRLTYSFEQSDQFQYLLLPYRSIYEKFLVGDWFTWETTHYHIAFSWLIRGLSLVCGVDWMPHGVLAVHVLVLFGIVVGLSQMARAAGLRQMSVIICLFIIAYVRQVGIAGAKLNHGVLLPADMAMAPFLLSCVAAMKRRYTSAGLWLGLSGLLHANFAVSGLLVVGTIVGLCALSEKKWRELGLFACGFVLVSFPNLLIIISEFLLSDSNPEGLEILYKTRSPHHYSPKLGLSSGTWWIVTLFVASLHLWLKRGDEFRKSVFSLLIAVMAILQIVAGIATIMEIGLVVRLFLWRFSVPLFMLLALTAGENLIGLFRSRRLDKILLACMLSIQVVVFAAGGRFHLWPKFSLAGAGLLLPLIIPLVFSSLVIAHKKLSTKLRNGLIAVMILSLTWTLVASIPELAKPKKHEIRWGKIAAKWPQHNPYRKKHTTRGKSLRKIYSWIRKKTPSDAVFLIPPGLKNFRLQTRRAVFVDIKSCPMKGEELIEWRRRLLAVVGMTKFPASGYRLSRVANARYMKRPIKALGELARKEKLTHILVSKKKSRELKNLGLKRLKIAGRLAVYEVRGRRPRKQKARVQ
ncbi:MAG: hypothetical protein GY847_17665 [Proteobacteria bacterium]|nr:hypothetical protein [Pseudomonadota bacterium]